MDGAAIGEGIEGAFKFLFWVIVILFIGLLVVLGLYITDGDDGTYTTDTPLVPEMIVITKNGVSDTTYVYTIDN